MIMKFIVIIIATAIAYATGYEEVCCQNVGCFQTDGVFSHLPAPACPEVINPTFALYTRANPTRPVYIHRNKTLPKLYDNTKMTMFLVHGYQGSPESEFTLGAKTQYLDNVDANVIIVGWVNGSTEPWYPDSAANTRAVGAEIAALVNRLKYETGASHTAMWCVGISLGAHTCGFAGMKTRFDRITGLDPAGPWFDGQDEKARINPNTARFVDIIHTDGGGATHYGMLTPVGDIDFYPNTGKHQPGCITGLIPNKENTEHPLTMDAQPFSVYCSHYRSAQYFVQSLIDENCFISRQICTDPHDIPGSCRPCKSGEICAIMGATAGDYDNLSGLYYLDTTSSSPYCLF